MRIKSEYKKAILLIFLLSSLNVLNSCKDNAVIVVPPRRDLSPPASSFGPDFAFDWTSVTYRIISDQQPNPPKASRIYSYVAAAIYESVAPGIPASRSLAGQLRNMSQMPAISQDSVYDWPAVITASASRVLNGIFDTLYSASANLINQTYINEYNLRVTAVGQEITDRSIRHGSEIGDAIIQWSRTDMYRETRTMVYVIPPRSINPAFWEPINPGDKPVEPYWGLITPFVLETPEMFTIHNNIPFDTLPGSAFYNEADEIKQIGFNLTQEQKDIAVFWNDKLRTGTPPGHWFSIASQVMQQRDYRLDKAAQVFVLLGAAGRDAFIACWKEKYIKNLLRPETYIRDYITDFYPYIQTPSFPEYPSGHSTVSGASSEVLTQLIGNNISFTDMTHVPINLEPRTFNSFYSAATEAGFSRMYGGIHFRTANLNAIQIGRSIGSYAVTRIKFYTIP